MPPRPAHPHRISLGTVGLNTMNTNHQTRNGGAARESTRRTAAPTPFLPGWRRTTIDQGPHRRAPTGSPRQRPTPEKPATRLPIEQRPKRCPAPRRRRCRSGRNSAGGGPPARPHRSTIRRVDTAPARRGRGCGRGIPPPHQHWGRPYTVPRPPRVCRPGHEECHWTVSTSQRSGRNLVTHASQKSNSALMTRTGRPIQGSQPSPCEGPSSSTTTATTSRIPGHNRTPTLIRHTTPITPPSGTTTTGAATDEVDTPRTFHNDSENSMRVRRGTTISSSHQWVLQHRIGPTALRADAAPREARHVDEQIDVARRHPPRTQPNRVPPRNTRPRILRVSSRRYQVARTEVHPRRGPTRSASGIGKRASPCVSQPAATAKSDR